jgi:hypothetical protein
MKRRTFLRGTAAAVAAGLLPSGSTCSRGETTKAAGTTIGVSRTTPFGGNGVMIPEDGWRMWPDIRAEWKDDEIFLPEDMDFSKLPVNPPTGGWEVLDGQLGTALTLPATVEQYHWGLTGLRPYHDEYRFETADPDVKNGAYYGVSWWWREIEIPASFLGRRILLHVRAARQRAEVYLNRKLVGYSILEELPFECDLTAAAIPEKNFLAIRITNPGGRFDWVDGGRMTWGHLEFQKSHGFGGLDRALMLSAHGDVRIADAWVLNTPEAHKISAHATLHNAAPQAQTGSVHFAVRDPRTQKVLANIEVAIEVPAGATVPVSSELFTTSAQLWDLGTPTLYRLEASWHPRESKLHAETRTVDFGFRWFAVDGLGQNAIFRLNGRRIRIYTSISWGYWALNGLFPIPELAEKEVRAAKTLNLNTLNFHRNLAKEDVLYIQDRLGLMRCLEPGGGSQAVVPSHSGARVGTASPTAQRYMQAKIKGMIRAFRSHPSVIHYILQNEGSVDPNNPNLDAIFAVMQQEDPSRSILAADGFVMRSPEAWTQAYGSTVHKSFKPATVNGGSGGWWVDHTGHFSDVWVDAYYNSPTDFYYYSPIRDEIVEWGEMKGAANIDNHAQMLRQIAAHGGKSYDLLDHQEVLRAYDDFLDRWGFRKAFPTAEQLFLSIGRRAYESWGQFMENVRLCDNNDMAAISGWESTAIENHSGLTDDFRDFKADPRAISSSLLPVRPIAKQRQLCLAIGGKATFDIYLCNDSNKPVSGKLVFTVTDPKGVSRQLATFDTPSFETDRFTYLIHEAFTTDALNLDGMWRFRLSLQDSPTPAFVRELLVVAPTPRQFRSIKVGLASLAPSVEEQLRAIPGVTVEAFRPGADCDVLMASGGSQDSENNAAVDAEGAYKPTGPLKEFELPTAVLDAVRSGTPLLACTPSEGQAAGVARQLAQAGAFQYKGLVGPSRASWMGSWYFVREHPLFDGLPVNQALGLHYQVKGGDSNGWLVEGDDVEIVAAYSRDHDRAIGAGLLTVKLGSTPIVLHQITSMQAVLHRRLLANALAWLVRPWNDNLVLPRT